MSKINVFRNLLKEASNISLLYGFEITPEIIVERYSEPHRYWHTPSHLYHLLKEIKELYKFGKLTQAEYHILVIVAIFHDIVYDPKRTDNEEASVGFMMSTFEPENVKLNPEIRKISDIILGTKTHDSKDKLSIIFNKLDTSILDANFNELLDWEMKIYKEYEWVGVDTYKKKRIEFIKDSIKDHPENSINLKKLIKFIKKENYI
jgi:pantetheine-phosphate adenylyltransferase